VRLSGLESQRTLAIYLAAGAAFAALAARGLTIPLYAHELGADRFQVGALFSVATLAAAVLSMPSGLLIDRFGARSLLIFSIVAMAGSQLAAAAATTVLPLYIWQVVGGLGSGAQMAALLSAVTESVKSGRLGRAMGWLTFSMQAGFFIGPSIAGLLLNWLDIRTDLALTTALLIFSVPGAMLASGTRQSSRRCAPW
jgi:MFS family permease